MSKQGLIVDIFAGFGGASVGIEEAFGRPVDIAINHDRVAIECHERNHPKTTHLHADVWEIDPLEATGTRPIDFLWASPDCTHFSRAKGAKPKDKNIRSLAWVVRDWAVLKRPRVIGMENVSEFQDWGPLDDKGRPIAGSKGETFRAFVAMLRDLGYSVEWRVLNAADYGAPTARMRLFLFARRDGLPIVWPEPTHGPGREHPYRTAAECIDWTIPCPSIFLTREEANAAKIRCKRPLAEKTMIRIAEGVRRFVLEAGDDVFVTYAQHGGCNRSAHAPMHTITASTKDQNCIVVPTLIQTGHGERPGQAPRVPGLHKPLGAVCAGGSKRGLVAAMLTKHYGGVVGTDLRRTTGSITARDSHAITAASLRERGKPLQGGEPGSGGSMVIPEADRSEQVWAFLMKYYGSGANCASLLHPMHTITAKDRMSLVTVRGVTYEIVDIGMRMLQSHELLAAQFGRFAPLCDLSGVKKQGDQIRLIGNSVPPEIVEQLVRANIAELCPA